MYYLTGDTHGEFNRVVNFAKMNETTKDDVLIILGDSGVNFYEPNKARKGKEQLAALPLTIFCVRGNHEERAEFINSYEEATYCGGRVYIEPEFPNIIFPKDGEFFDFDGNIVLVIGGAYSVDKEYRMIMRWNWFESEQLTDDEKRAIEKNIDANGWKSDYVLTHTCPFCTRPVHLFLNGIDPKSVDTSMEVWLQKVADRLEFKHWYFGHYHDDWDNGKYSMLYKNVVPLGRNK